MLATDSSNDARSGTAQIPAASTHATYSADTRVDLALLGSALFLQRFWFGNSGISLDMAAAAIILAYQFAVGRLFIQYDRLLWFLALTVAVTSSLWFNFRSTMLASYGAFLVMYFFFTLTRPSSRDRYRSTLEAFQFLVLIISCLAIAQFLAQFFVDGRRLIMFFDLVPEYLLAPLATWGPDAQLGSNTIIPVTSGSWLLKSNGIFLSEPSTLSQIAALAILIEVLEFRRPRYLFLLALGLLFSYSGTGITILALFLPFAGLVNGRSQAAALFVGLVACALLVTGIIDLGAYSSRVGEFEDVNGSGFMRFVSSFWMAGEHFDTASLPALLRGNGPATMKEFNPRAFYVASGGTWFKVLYEYGLIGAFIFICYLVVCFRGSRCPRLLIMAFFYFYLFTGNTLLSTSLLTIMVVVCTLSGPERRGGARAENRDDEFALVPGSAKG